MEPWIEVERLNQIFNESNTLAHHARKHGFVHAATAWEQMAKTVKAMLDEHSPG